MIAATHYRLEHSDLQLVLALQRGGSLARAAVLLGQDVSTVFRAIHRLEKAMGAQLFEKPRSGYRPTPLAERLGRQAELAEQALQQARGEVQEGSQALRGTVRLTCSEAVLQALVAPALGRFMAQWPGVELLLDSTRHFANLSRHEADLAIRITDQPPLHLIGQRLAGVHYVMCGHPRLIDQDAPGALPWIALRDEGGEHPTTTWRRAQFPAAQVACQAHGLHALAQLALAGLGLALLPTWLVAAPLRVLEADTRGCDSALWLLMRPDCRAQPSVSHVFDALRQHCKAH